VNLNTDYANEHGMTTLSALARLLGFIAGDDPVNFDLGDPPPAADCGVVPSLGEASSTRAVQPISGYAPIGLSGGRGNEQHARDPLRQER
jgi:hypothetical protein